DHVGRIDASDQSAIKAGSNHLMESEPVAGEQSIAGNRVAAAGPVEQEVDIGRFTNHLGNPPIYSPCAVDGSVTSDESEFREAYGNLDCDARWGGLDLDNAR